MNKHISSKILLLLILTICSSITFSQTVINYQTWTGASGCNIFSSSTNVPATINGSNATIAHLTAIGQPVYSSSDNAISLDSKILNGSQNQGTEYRTTVNFQAGYSYKITINASRIKTQQTGGDVLLRLDLNNGGSGNNTQCTGTGNIDASGSGNLKQSHAITTTGFLNYEFNYTSLSAAQAYLMVAAIPPASSVFQTILIRKITIEETGPDLTVTPTSLATTCGASLTQTFTVNNPFNVANITSYEWNLGASNNGWVYNGSAAPQNISTTSNSITLTSVCGTIPQNVAVTVKVNNANYRTYTIPVTTNAGPALSISTGDLCSGSRTYSINNLPCNATVTWGTPTPSGVVTHSVNNNQITLTKQNDGNVTLSATVTTTNACTTNLTVTSKDIRVGSPALPVSVNGASLALANSQYNYYLQVPWGLQVSNFNWTIPSGWRLIGGQGTGYITLETGTSSGVVQVDVDDACGVTHSPYLTVVIGEGGDLPLSVCCGEGEEYARAAAGVTTFPNPASDMITVSLTGVTAKLKNNFIRQIKITNKMGLVVRNTIFTDKAKSKQLNIALLKPDIYTIQVYNNKTWHSIKFIKK